MSNFRQIGGSRVYKGWKDWEEGDYVIGKYEELYEDNYGKNGYAIRIEETNIEDSGFDRGSLFGANACGSLDFKMETVNIGQVVKLVYAGKEPITKGKYKGKEFHNVDLYVDDEYGAKVKEDTVEVQESLDDEEIL